MLPQIIRKNQAVSVGVLLALCAVLFFFRLGARPIWDIDEGKHAEISREMVLSGDWITPAFNGQAFYDKPALFTWLGALAFLALGFTEFAARLPSAILATGCVLITFLMGRKLADTRTGLLGGVILATALEFVVLGRTIVHDISLVFFVTLSLFLFYLGYEDFRHRKRNLLFSYAAMGLAALSKGPLGLVLPGMVIGTFLIFEKKLNFIRQMHLGWGFLIFLAVAAPWYILISLKNPGYAHYFFVYQNLGSFGSADPRHPQPFYYYIPVFLGGFFPWSCFFPQALIYAMRRRFQIPHSRIIFLALWIAVIFIFFSIAGSKLPTYILPIFPAAALLTALLWRRLLDTAAPDIRRAFLYAFLPVAIIFLGALIYLWASPLAEVEYETGISPMRMNLAALWMVGFILGAGILSAAKKDKAAFIVLTAMIVTSLHVFLLVIVPRVNPYRTTRELALSYDRMIPPHEKFTFYKRIKESALFYTGRRARVLKNSDQLHAYLDSKQRVFCLITRGRFEEIKTPVYVVAGEGNKLLISNRSN
jgi:4-amino-4-deoxy-L-arabinose transferase-like glycosyltransferase